MISEIVGTALILVIAVAVISALYTVVLANPSPIASSYVSLVGMVDGETILIEHCGGKALGMETLLKINYNNGVIDEYTIADSDFLDDEAKKDNLWTIGEQLVYPYSFGSAIEITVIDQYNTIIFNGVLDINSD